MHLITVAHLGEAQGIIQRFNLIRVKPDLFKNEELVLILTGEGPFEAATKTALTIPQYPFKSILNVGIAGTLDPSIEIGSIHPVRTHYLIQDLKPAFKTFQGTGLGLDCLTSFERILEADKAQKLKGMGALVDREAWGVAMAAKTAGLPFQSYKLVSDLAGTLAACEIVKADAEIFAEKLSEHLSTLLKAEAPLESLSIPGFHFTFTTQKRYETLLKKLHLKNESAPTLPLNELREESISPKERTKKLLNHMEEMLDPLKTKISKTIDKLVSTFEDKDLKLNVDPQWEKRSVTISFEVENDQDLLKKSEALRKLSIEPYTKLMNGDIHVE